MYNNVCNLNNIIFSYYPIQITVQQAVKHRIDHHVHNQYKTSLTFSSKNQYSWPFRFSLFLQEISFLNCNKTQYCARPSHFHHIYSS